MAWSWSHTNEGYANAYENLRELPVETLREIYAEWAANEPTARDADYEGFSPSIYARALAGLADTNAETLAEQIWDAASEQATCDNGGFNAWMCPYGCGPHTVPFDRVEVQA